MTFLAPWALFAGIVVAAGLVVLHLVARQRPAAYPLPTARFVPERRSLVRRASWRPRDLLLLLLRVLLVLSAAMAFAQPVLAPRRRGRARVLMLDRSAAMTDPAAAIRRAREIANDGVPTWLVTFDSAAVSSAAPASVRLDSLAGDTVRRSTAVGSLSAAFVAARRTGAQLGRGADSVELVLVSALSQSEWDAATDSLRVLWPGAVRVERARAAVDTAGAPALERAIGVTDVLGPALVDRVVQASAHGVRVLRRAAAAADSAFARDGGVVVRWDSIGARHAEPAALAMGDDVVVASLAPFALPPGGLVLARWSDGTSAAVERPLGSGCLREVGVGVPVAGDLPLRSSFRRIVNGLTAACIGHRAASGPLLDSARAARIAGGAGAARGASLTGRDQRTSPVTPWLLGVALACALAELALRRDRADVEAA